MIKCAKPIQFAAKGRNHLATHHTTLSLIIYPSLHNMECFIPQSITLTLNQWKQTRLWSSFEGFERRVTVIKDSTSLRTGELIQITQNQSNIFMYVINKSTEWAALKKRKKKPKALLKNQFYSFCFHWLSFRFIDWDGKYLVVWVNTDFCFLNIYALIKKNNWVCRTYKEIKRNDVMCVSVCKPIFGLWDLDLFFQTWI